jgi:hypothetical protein
VADMHAAEILDRRPHTFVHRLGADGWTELTHEPRLDVPQLRVDIDRRVVPRPGCGCRHTGEGAIPVQIRNRVEGPGFGSGGRQPVRLTDLPGLHAVRN